MRDRFADYHPLVNFSYFTLVIGFAMALNHPLAQAISLSCALAYAAQAEGKKAALFALKFCLPVALLTAAANLLFSHKGVTVLLRFPTGSPLTLESLLYGLSAGVMIATVMLWFVNFHRVITSDKLICLFGRILPAMSLVLSMTLRFIPRFQAQLHDVVDAQKSLGRELNKGPLRERLKLAVTTLSILVTWALENAIETADSMKNRGYGLPGRSAFTVYRLERRDKLALLGITICGAALLAGCGLSAFGFRYFPSIRYAGVNAVTLTFQTVYLILCSMPMAIHWAEERKWKAIRSKM